MPDREIQRITDGEPNGHVGIVDGGGNALFAWGVNRANSNDSYIHVRRYNPAGAVTGDWEREIGVDQNKSKLSGVGLAVAGADLWVTYWGHSTIYTVEPRHGFARVAVFAGIVVPGTDPRLGPAYADENLPEISGGSGGGGGEPVDYALIEQIVAGQIDRLIGEFGGGSVRGGLEEKAKDAAVELLTVAEDPRGQAYRPALLQFLMDGLYQWAKDRTYEGATAALEAWEPLRPGGGAEPEQGGTA